MPELRIEQNNHTELLEGFVVWHHAYVMPSANELIFVCSGFMNLALDKILDIIRQIKS